MTTCRETARITCVAALLFIGAACAKKAPDSGGLVPNGSDTTTISGVVEKGPFVKGAVVSVFSLGASLDRVTQASANGQTLDDTGRYAIGSQGGVVEISALGRYYDEVSGGLTREALNLTAYADLAISTTVNINVLTTLSAGRIKRLVAGGKTFAQAKAQAQREVLAAFNIPADGVADFDQMSIAQNRASDAILLAASAILQGQNTTGALRDLIFSLATDLAENGEVTDKAHVASLVANAMALDLDAVRANLSRRYSQVGAPVTLPYFDDFVMSDGVTLNGDIAPTVALKGAPAAVGNATSGLFSMAVVLVGKHVEKAVDVTLSASSPIVGISPQTLTFTQGLSRTPQQVELTTLDHAAPGPITVSGGAGGLETGSQVIDYKASTVVEVVSLGATPMSDNRMALGPGGEVYVLTDNGISKTGTQGAPAQAWGPAGLSAPKVIAVDASGNVFVDVVVGTYQEKIIELDPNGQPIADPYYPVSGVTNALLAADGKLYAAIQVLSNGAVGKQRAIVDITNPAAATTVGNISTYGFTDMKLSGDCFYITGRMYTGAVVQCLSLSSPKEIPKDVVSLSEFSAATKGTSIPASITLDGKNIYLGTTAGGHGVVTKALDGKTPAQLYCPFGVGATQSGPCGGGASIVDAPLFLRMAPDGIPLFVNGAQLLKIVPTP